MALARVLGGRAVGVGCGLFLPSPLTRRSLTGCGGLGGGCGRGGGGGVVAAVEPSSSCFVPAGPIHPCTRFGS
jgi:hypothetical protein